MNFDLDEEQRAMVETCEEFAEERLAPNYQRWDREETFPRDLFAEMAELGLTGLRTPPDDGGMDLDYVTCGLVTEAIAKGDFNMAYVPFFACLCGEILAEHAPETLRSEWLGRMAEGSDVIGLALTEPHAGSDAGAIQTEAVHENGIYRISGQKSGITLGAVADALVLFARTGGEGPRGISAFLVPTDREGVNVQPLDDMGERPVKRANLEFTNVEIPENHRIGGEGKGFTQVMNGFDFSRFLIGLMCLGAARVSLDETMEYVKEREAFGKKLGEFEGVSFPIAEHYTRLDAARLQCLRGLWLRNDEQDHTKEAAMSKWWAPKISVETIHDCIILHGHYGYTKDLPLEQRLRDVIGLEIGDGTPQIQKMIVARELLGDEFKPY